MQKPSPLLVLPTKRTSLEGRDESCSYKKQKYAEDGNGNENEVNFLSFCTQQPTGAIKGLTKTLSPIGTTNGPLEFPSNERIEPEEEIDLFADSPPNSPPPINSQCKPSLSHISYSHSDDWDDKEGRLKYRIGERIAERYEVIGYFGKGSFGNVLKVKDEEDNKEYAIKVARSHREMKSAFTIEKKVLEKLRSLPRSYCIELVHSFEFKKHSCLVLQSMKESVRDLLHHIGSINLKGIRTYANQLCRALHFLHSLGAIHGDVKPDNILVGHNQSIVKLCDFGTSVFPPRSSMIPQEYGTLYYRAPEVILGYDTSYQIDVWSLACCLLELFTGNVLFKGTSNNHLLSLFMTLCGPIPKKIVRNGRFSSSHFDIPSQKFKKENFIDGRLLARYTPMSNKPTLRIFEDILLPFACTESRIELKDFANLLERMLTFEPSKRITPLQALSHPFLFTPK